LGIISDLVHENQKELLIGLYNELFMAGRKKLAIDDLHELIEDLELPRPGNRDPWDYAKQKIRLRLKCI
jgi:hypothetical protein